jgi:membrane protease YdiL (CAAX protease family)
LSSSPLAHEDTPKILTRGYRRVLLLWLIAALVGASVAYRYFFRAFPEASVNFQVTRGAALERARTFALQLGVSLQGHQSAVVFDVNDDTKTYLERELGLQEANRLMSSNVSVWYWQVRFFRPREKEEVRVRVDPAGRIVGYDHVLEEAAPGARLERAEALNAAQQFIDGTLHTNLSNYSFLPDEANSLARPNRTDWSFTWERKGFRVKDAPYRLTVTVQGSQIGGYSEFLKVPEAWQRGYARLRSSNNFIETIAVIPYAVLIGAALAVLIMLARRGLIRWKSAVALGVFIAALYFAMQLNQWPLIRAEYNTNDSYASFVATELGRALIESLSLALLVVIAFAPGEPLYRADQPSQLRLGSAFTLTGMRTRQFFCSGVVGLCLAAVHIGFVVAFYVLGRRFGVWAPQDLQYSDTLSTALPWIYPLTIGIYAAASEEFLFRMFSIRFLMRVTHWRILAVVLPAFAWGFLHSNYPQEPPYIRGIEVGSIGIVAGWVMLRWGIIATLIWHYSVDAFLTSLSLMRSGELYTRISGGLVGFAAAIPVIVAGVLYLRTGAFVDESALLNRVQPLTEPTVTHPEPVSIEQSPVAYVPLTKRAILLLAIATVVGFSSLWAIKTQSIGSFVRFSLDSREAARRADDALRQLGQNPASYHRAITIQYTFDPLINEYLRRTIGIQGANRVYRDEVPAAFWTARYFRNSQSEEYFIVLLPDGRLHSVHHTLAEATAGANLTKDEAQNLAEDFLRTTKKVELTEWKIIQAQSNKLPARTDHNFVWEQLRPLNPPAPGGETAHVRISLAVQGSEVSSYRIFIHLPEDWVRRQNATTLANTAQTVIFRSLLGGLLLAVLVIFLRNLKSWQVAAVPWRRIAVWSVIVLAAALVRFVTLEPQYLALYPTTQPFGTYLGTLLIGQTLLALLLYSATIFLLGLAVFFLSQAYGVDRLPIAHALSGAYYRDAVLVTVSGWAVFLGLARLRGLIGTTWPVAHYSLAANLAQGLDANWPALSVFANVVMFSIASVGAIALALGFAGRYIHRAGMQWVFLLAFAIFSVSRWGSIGDFVQSATLAFVELAVIWWGAKFFVRLNLLGYFLLTALLTLTPEIEGLLRQPNAYFRANGGILVAIAAMLFILPLVVRRITLRRAAISKKLAVPV